MKFRKQTHFMIGCGILFLCLYMEPAFSQMNLVQRFNEQNISGTTTFGWSVSSAGDVNNDGYDDVIVGADGYNSDTGRAYIYLGGSGMDNTADATMTGEGTENYFGWSVSSAGDVNNDGYDDVIVGADGYNSDTGRAYIYLGGSGMDNTADVTMTGEGTYDDFGSSVSSAGDVNNDGYDDVIVGAPMYDSYTGRAYVYLGGSGMDNTADVILTGEDTWNFFGISVSGAGDVNNDGYDDVIVGADGFGRAYVYLGGSGMDNTADVTMTGEGTGNQFGCSVSCAGDVNNDGYDDVIVGAVGFGRAYVYLGGSYMDDAADVTMTGEGTSSAFGCSVSGAGDVNYDEHDDVIVGAPMYDSYTGRAYVYLGGSGMDNTADVTMTGEGTGNEFGISGSGAGDVNNDGYDDVIVGAELYNSYIGRAYVFFGGSSMDAAADVTMTGMVVVQAQIKVFLQGPYNTDTDMMNDVLRTAGPVPLTSPYTADARTVPVIPANIVDWVLVEMRSTATGSAIVSRSSFLHKDGRIVGDDGTTDIISMAADPGDYYIVVRHRNHLAVMSANTVTLSSASATLYDFSVDDTTPFDKYYGGDAATLETGVRGMVAGDGNDSGICSIADGNLALADRDNVGYYVTDYNLSGIVTISDVNLSDSNRDKTTAVN